MGKIEVSAEDVKGIGPVLLAGTWFKRSVSNVQMQGLQVGPDIRSVAQVQSRQHVERMFRRSCVAVESMLVQR